MTDLFDVTNPIVLEDERVFLRLLKREDYNHLLPFALHEPELWKYSLLTGEGEKGLYNYIQNALKEYELQHEFPFIVFDKKVNAFAGSTRFYDINIPYKTIQLGYTWYGKQFQRTGLNKHCKFLILQFAFEKLNLLRVELRADAQNERSILAMRNIGCTIEGILRSHMPKRDGGRRDSIILSILKNEWDERVKAHLLNQLQRDF